MEEINDNDIDKTLLQLQKELEKIKQGTEGRADQSKNLRRFPSLGIALEIPDGFFEADEEKTASVFFSKNRPDLVLINPSAHSGLTFQTAILEKKTFVLDLYHEREQMIQILKRADGKNVFYDQGNVTGNVPMVWFDYKSFAADERVYNMMFLILSDRKMMVGTFYCIFKDYDKWRPVILRMLETIQTEEEECERI
jgi:hypothetical protein